MKKKLVALLMAVVMLFALAACGTETEAPAEAPAAAPAETPAPAPAEAPAKEKIVTYASWLVMPQEWLDQVKADTGITIEYEQIESKNYADIITTRLSGGTGPDVFYAYNLDCVKLYCEAGYGLDLSGYDWFNSNIRADYIEEAKKYGDGKAYGFSEVVSNSNLLYYNKDIFAQYNIELPTNIDELVAVCDTLVANGVTPFIHSVAEPNHLKRLPFEPIVTCLAQNGGSDWVASLATGESKFTDEIYVKATEYFVNAVNNGYFSDLCEGITHVEAWDLFCQGEAAMMTGASFYFDQNYKDVRPDFDLGITAGPFNYDGTPHVCGSKYSEFIMGNANNGNDAATLEYLQYFAEHLADWSKYTGMMTPSTKSLGDWSDWAWMFDAYKSFSVEPSLRQPSSVQGDLEAWEQGVFAGTAGTEGPEMLQGKLDGVI